MQLAGKVRRSQEQRGSGWQRNAAYRDPLTLGYRMYELTRKASEDHDSLAETHREMERTRRGSVEHQQHGGNINGTLGQYNDVNPVNLRQIGYQPSQGLPINVPEKEFR
jgi:hypothetical protein